MANPALRQRGQDVLIVNFDGTSATVKGTVRNFETTASEANLPFADAGRFVGSTIPATGSNRVRGIP